MYHWMSDFPQRCNILEPYFMQGVQISYCLMLCSIWSRRFYLSLHEGQNFDWKPSYGVQCRVAVFREIHLLYDHEKQSGMPFPRSVDKRAFTSDQEIHRRHNSIANHKELQLRGSSSTRARCVTLQLRATLVRSRILDLDHVRRLQQVQGASAEQVHHFRGAV